MHRRRREREFKRASSHASVNPYGVLEAKWLGPAGSIPGDVAKDPKACLVAVTIELREHAIAHAARVLRESGATPAQMKVGIQLALGKAKPVIADELGIQFSSVDDLTRKLYQTLDVHNAAELSTKIWLGEHKPRRVRICGAPGNPRASCASRPMPQNLAGPYIFMIPLVRLLRNVGV